MRARVISGRDRILYAAHAERRGLGLFEMFEEFMTRGEPDPFREERRFPHFAGIPEL